MPHIKEDANACTVIVTVEAETEVLSEVEDHATEGLGKFSEYPGFLAGATHRSVDGTRVVQYLQWQSRDNYVACMTDSRWDNHPSTARFSALVDQGAARVDVRIYDVVKTSKS